MQSGRMDSWRIGIRVINAETLSVAFGNESHLVPDDFSILIWLTAECVSRWYDIRIRWWYNQVEGSQFFNLRKFRFNRVAPVMCFATAECVFQRRFIPYGHKYVFGNVCSPRSINSASSRPIALSRRSAI